MIHAYDKVYLEVAQTTLGTLLDYAVHELEYELDSFFNLFVQTGLAQRFGEGDFTLIAGKSGVELAYETLSFSSISHTRSDASPSFGRSEEYWTGWALAYFQWSTALSFNEIVSYIPLQTIQSIYHPYHEMDIRHFNDAMNELFLSAKKETNLKIRRKRMGLSQSKLAETSRVPLRTIQQYEQRQKSINKAQGEYLAKLAKALFCTMEDLLEYTPNTAAE